jgi:hypothetical protein
MNQVSIPDTEQIPGYDYGRSGAARSPLSLEELRQLEATDGRRLDQGRAITRYPVDATVREGRPLVA